MIMIFFVFHNSVWARHESWQPSCYFLSSRPIKLRMSFATVMSDDALTPMVREESMERGASMFSVIESALSRTLFVFVIVWRSSFRIKKICIPRTTKRTVRTRITMSNTSWTGSIIVYADIFDRLFIDYLNGSWVSSKSLERELVLDSS